MIMNIINFFFASTISTYINFLIIIITLYCIVEIIEYYLKYKKEKNNINILTDIYSENEDKIFSRIFDRLKELDQPSVIYKIVYNLCQIKIKGLDITENTFSKLIEDNSFQYPYSPKIISSSLILLGLLGTILGLSTSLQNLNSTLNMDHNNIEPMIESITNILAGLKIAFSCTIMAIICTIIIITLNSIFVTRIKRVENEFGSLVTDKLLPLLLEPKYIEVKAEDTNEISLIYKNTYQLIEKLADRFIDISKTTSTDYSKFYGLMYSLTNSMSRSIEPLKRDLAIQQETHSIVQEFKSLATSINTNISEYTKSYELSVKKIQEFIEKVEIKHNDIDNLIIANKDNYKTLDEAVSKMDKFKDNFIDVLNKLSDNIIGLENKIITNVNSFAIYSKEIGNNIEKISTNMGDVLKQTFTENFGCLMSNLQNELSKLYQNTEEVINKNIALNSERMTNYEEKITQKLAEFAFSQTSLSLQLEELSKILKTMSELQISNTKNLENKSSNKGNISEDILIKRFDELKEQNQKSMRLFDSLVKINQDISYYTSTNIITRLFKKRNYENN